MSAAMRSTLQTVPESLEVTKNADPTSSAKTPVKTSSEANKSSRSYNYHPPSSTNKVGPTFDTFHCYVTILVWKGLFSVIWNNGTDFLCIKRFVHLKWNDASTLYDCCTYMHMCCKVDYIKIYFTFNTFVEVLITQQQVIQLHCFVCCLLINVISIVSDPPTLRGNIFGNSLMASVYHTIFNELTKISLHALCPIISANSIRIGLE